MARAALKWSTAKLAQQADVTTATVNYFENGRDAYASTIEKLKTTLEQHGIIFIPENGDSVGVRLKKEADS